MAKVDAIWHIIEPTLSYLEKEIILGLSNVLTILNTIDAPTKDDFVKGVCAMMPTESTETIELLIKKQYLGIVYPNYVYLNVVNDPVNDPDSFISSLT